MNGRDTMYCKENDLYIGGVSAAQLAKQYGTPLYVMDIEHIEKLVLAFKSTINKYYGAGNGNIAYASKALSATAMYAIMKKLNANADVVSGGEIYTALKAGFDLKNAYFHGNNKLESELELAMKNGIGKIVVDGANELPLINDTAAKCGVTQKILVRVNPGVEAHTHSFIQTAKADSKFGAGITNGEAEKIVKSIAAYKNLEFYGLHCHIGSQIFDAQAFKLATSAMTSFISVLESGGYPVAELNMGGGFGIYYKEGDPKYTVDDYCSYIKAIIERLNDDIEQKKISKPYLTFEPGRSIVGEAGITLYRVGNIKDIPNIKRYVSIDGGMFDNMRPSLYDAEYEAIVVNKAQETPVQEVDITGKCCESADILIKKIKLPVIEIGDLIAVFSTGAYNYSMANNYNRNKVPPMVGVKKGVSGYMIKPQTYEYITQNDNVEKWMTK